MAKELLHRQNKIIGTIHVIPKAKVAEKFSTFCRTSGLSSVENNGNVGLETFLDNSNDSLIIWIKPVYNNFN